MNHGLAQLAAQAPDENLNGVRVAIEILGIDMFDQRAAGHDLARMVHQISQHPVLVAGELDRGARGAHTGAARIQGHAGNCEYRRRHTAGAVNERTKAGQQLFHAKRFGQIVVGAGVHAVDLLVPFAACGEHEHRRVHSGGAPTAQHAESVQARQSQVQHDRVIGFARPQMGSVLAVGRPIHGVTRLA